MSGGRLRGEETVNQDETGLKAQAVAFLAEYDAKLGELEIPAALAEWKAANSGKAEDYDEAAAAVKAI